MKKTLTSILSWTSLGGGVALGLWLTCCSPEVAASSESSTPKKPSPFVIEGKDEWGYGRTLCRVRDVKTGEFFILFFEPGAGSSISHIPNSKEP